MAIPSGWFWPTPSPPCGHADYKSPNHINVDPDATDPAKWRVNCYRDPDFKFANYGPFTLKANADAYKAFLPTCQEPTSPSGPTGAGNNPHGVRQLYTPKGSYRLNFSTNHQGSSRRWEAGNDPPMNMEMTGYFTGQGDDTVSAKVRGGRHTSSDPQAGCCYIPQAPTGGGPAEFQIECPHPNNHDCGMTRDANCIGIENGWRGYKVITWNTANNCVYLELWEDKGNSQSSPGNNWVRVMHHTDCNGNCGNIDSPLLKPKKSSSQATWRIDEVGAQAKWTSAVEIIPGSTTPGGGTPETPGGGEIPEPEQAPTSISLEWVDVWHMGQDAGESCEAGGNITPTALVDLWDLAPPTPATYMDLFAGSNIRAGIYIKTTASRLYNKIPREWNFTIQKFGTPSGMLKFVEYDLGPLFAGTGNSIFVKQIGIDIDVGTLTTGVDTEIQIEDLANNTKIKTDHAFFIEYEGGDVNNKIRVRQTDIDYTDSSDTMFAYASFTGAWFRSPSRDFPSKIRGN